MHWQMEQCVLSCEKVFSVGSQFCEIKHDEYYIVAMHTNKGQTMLFPQPVNFPSARPLMQSLEATKNIMWGKTYSITQLIVKEN